MYIFEQRQAQNWLVEKAHLVINGGGEAPCRVGKGWFWFRKGYQPLTAIIEQRGCIYMYIYLDCIGHILC